MPASTALKRTRGVIEAILLQAARPVSSEPHRREIAGHLHQPNG